MQQRRTGTKSNSARSLFILLKHIGLEFVDSILAHACHVAQVLLHAAGERTAASQFPEVRDDYEAFPYFRAEKLENVAFHKVREVFLDGNLQLNERARDFNYLMELQLEKETKTKNKPEEKTAKEIEQEKKEEQELKEIKEFHYWQINHKKGRY